MQERRNSIANALELRLSCTNPSVCYTYQADTSVAPGKCRRRRWRSSSRSKLEVLKNSQQLYENTCGWCCGNHQQISSLSRWAQVELQLPSQAPPEGPNLQILTYLGGKNDHQFPDDIIQFIFITKYFSGDPIKKSSLIQIIARHRTGATHYLTNCWLSWLTHTCTYYSAS